VEHVKKVFGESSYTISGGLVETRGKTVGPTVGLTQFERGPQHGGDPPHKSDQTSASSWETEKWGGVGGGLNVSLKKRMCRIIYQKKVENVPKAMFPKSETEEDHPHPQQETAAVATPPGWMSKRECSGGQTRPRNGGSGPEFSNGNLREKSGQRGAVFLWGGGEQGTQTHGARKP